MLRVAVLFVFGVLCFHQLARLPEWSWLSGETALVLLAWRVRSVRPLFPLFLGFVWSHGYALATAPPRLADDDGVMRMVIEARVVSLIGMSGQTARFLVETDVAAGQRPGAGGTWRFRLSWRDPPEINPGETWRLPVRLRAAHGYASPGAWDYEGWLYWQGVRYTGYVDPGLPAERLSRVPCCALTRTRAQLAALVDAQPVSAFARGVVKALVVGDASGLPALARELFRSTGTSHLMAISGLHIGLLAGIGLVGVAWFWRRVPALCTPIPARVAGAVAGLVAAAVYAALAGLALPTQRALVMLLLFTLGLVLRRDHSTTHALAVAALGVVLWHPPSVVSAGFWLSFGAVLAILLAMRSGGDEPRWRAAVRIQLAVSLALWPVLSAFGMPASALAPLVNLVLVPAFGVLIVPLSLLGVALLVWLPPAGGVLLGVLGQLLDVLHHGLAAVADLGSPLADPAGVSGPALAALAMAIGLLLAPPGFPLRWLALTLLCVPGLPRALALNPGGFEVHVLDVGQGLSTVIETRRHTLVFDSGPEFVSGFSAANAVLVPFLARRGRTTIDRLILSHGDIDHAGGARDLLRRVTVHDLASGEPVRVGLGRASALQVSDGSGMASISKSSIRAWIAD